MVLDYLNASMLTIPITDLDIASIIKIVRCQTRGTRIHDVPNLNDVRDLLVAVPSVEFRASMKPRNLEDLEREIHENRPVIVYLGFQSENYPPSRGRTKRDR